MLLNIEISWPFKFKHIFLLIVLHYHESFLNEKDIVDVITATSMSRFNLFDIVFLFRKKKKTDIDMFIFKNLKFLMKMFVMIVASFFLLWQIIDIQSFS